MAPTRSRLALHAALLASGAAALAYETSWTRMLHRVFGVGDLAVATVLAAFFLGLGVGSWAASRYAARLERPAMAYAVIEAIIALYAIASPWIVPSLGTAYVAVGADAGPTVLAVWRLGLSLAVLLPPTLLMGATLPVLARVVGGEGWAKGVTALYVSNTLGAVIGVAAAGLWLIPTLGGRATTEIAAGLSLAAAAIVYATHRGVVTEREAPAAKTASDAPSSVLPIVLAALAGGAALASEVLWTRVLRTVLHATTQAFAGMLVTYLLGIAIGATIARRLARTGAARALGAAQLLAAVLTVLTMVAVPHVVRLVPLLQGRPSFTPNEAWTILFVSALLLFPLALTLGTGLPLAFSMAERAEAEAGRGSGRLLAANTLAGLLGSVLAGFVLIPALGIEASLFVVVFVHLVASGLALRSAFSSKPALRAITLTAPLAIGVALMLLKPSVQLPYLLRVSDEPMLALVSGPGEQWREPIVFLREGRSSTVTVERSQTGLRLENDGRPESGFGPGPVGFGAELVALGGLPTMFAERTERALAIGLGAGHTTSLLLEGGFEHVDVVELEAAVVDAARLLYEAREVPFPLDDPRASVVIDDARNRLAFADEGSYDAIVSQPSHPWLAGSSALYTREFFEEVDRALRDGGVFALWVNLFRIQPRQVAAVVGTLREVFPHVTGFVVEDTSLVLAAGRQPLRWGARLEERMGRLRERFLAPRGLADPASLARTVEIDGADAEVLGAGAPRIVDDRPLLEIELSRTPETARVTPLAIDRMLRDTPWALATTRAYDRPLAPMLIARIERVEGRPHALARLEATLARADLSGADGAMVEGALAEARGDVRGALRAYDGASTPDAAARADRLRLAEGMTERLLRVARDRGVSPADSTPLLSAALLADRPGALALAIESSADEPARALRSFAADYAARGCDAWSDRRDEVEALARQDYGVAMTAQACAFAAHERDEAARLGTIAVRARRAAGLAAFARGEQCVVGGNRGCAQMMFRRALREYPSHSASAAALARMLHARGRREEAREVLLRTMREVEGLPSSQAGLAALAAELGIDLGVEIAPETSPSSTAPTIETPGGRRED